MKKLTDTKYNEMYRAWKRLNDDLRQQVYAKELFGLNVDSDYGKIVEEKETGGIRLLPLPPKSDPKYGVGELTELMATKGWVYQVEKCSRSQLSIVRMRHVIKDLLIDPHPMPENHGRYFSALLALELEKESELESA